MMDALEQARREIDTVDAQLAALFERRMKAVLSVAEYKKAHCTSLLPMTASAWMLRRLRGCVPTWSGSTPRRTLTALQAMGTALPCTT